LMGIGHGAYLSQKIVTNNAPDPAPPANPGAGAGGNPPPDDKSSGADDNAAPDITFKDGQQ
jgi:hypothetical protein